LRESFKELAAEAGGGWVNFERAKLVIEAVFNRWDLAKVKRAGGLRWDELARLVERGQFLDFLLRRKVGEFQRPVSFGLKAVDSGQQFADAFCKWYSSKHGLVRPKVTVWSCWTNKAFDPVCGLVEYVDLHLFGQQKDSEYGSHPLRPDEVMARCLYSRFPPFLELFKPIFQTPTIIVFIVENLCEYVDNTSLKTFLTHESLHAVEECNSIIIIKQSNRTQVDRDELWAFTTEDPERARTEIKLSPPRGWTPPPWKP
jgi:hypothetical protein